MKAIAYVKEIENNGNKKVSVEEQKNKLMDYAKAMGLEIIAWYEDKVNTQKSALNRALASTDDFDVFLVEGVKSLGNTFSDVKPVMDILDNAGKAILEANYHWDVVSQKVRSHFKEKELKIIASLGKANVYHTANNKVMQHV